MINYRELMSEFRKLDLAPSVPLLVHTPPSSFEMVKGGAETLLGVLLSSFSTLIMPAFTFQTMIIPEVGPEGNALEYGSGTEQNLKAEFFRPRLPVDPSMGIVAERLHRYTQAKRSNHPILSFCGVNAEPFLDAQTREEPLALIGSLAQADGWILLIGVGQQANVSIHWAERQAGRKQFTRWALTPSGVVECPNFPGCPDGFPALEQLLDGVIRRVRFEQILVQALPVAGLLAAAQALIGMNPAGLLCDRQGCERCSEIRRGIG